MRMIMLDIKSVSLEVNLCSSSIFRLVKLGEFPSAYKSPLHRPNLWLETDIQEWLAQQDIKEQIRVLSGAPVVGRPRGAKNRQQDKTASGAAL